jgi:hypothetical protein
MISSMVILRQQNIIQLIKNIFLFKFKCWLIS